MTKPILSSETLYGNAHVELEDAGPVLHWTHKDIDKEKPHITIRATIPMSQLRRIWGWGGPKS